MTRWLPWLGLVFVLAVAWVPILGEQSQAKPGASPKQALSPEAYMQLAGPAEMARQLIEVRRAQSAADADRQKLMAQLNDLQRLIQKVEDQQDTIRELKVLLSTPSVSEQLTDQRLDQRVKVLEDSRQSIIDGFTKMIWLLVSGAITAVGAYAIAETRKYRLLKADAASRHADVVGVKDDLTDLIESSMSQARREGFEQGRQSPPVSPPPTTED